MEKTMSASNPSAAGTGQPADLQQLVGLLGNLMPLLVRFQSQTFAQFPIGANFGIPQPALEHQAAVSFIRDITAMALRNLSNYLDAHADRHAGLECCAPIVKQAERSLAARDYAQAFDLVWQAYRMIVFVRATDPQVPPLQAADMDGGAESGRTH
jgi:hypothetical protein